MFIKENYVFDASNFALGRDSRSPDGHHHDRKRKKKKKDDREKDK